LSNSGLILPILSLPAPDLLESAVMMPQASFGGQYVHHDIYEMAAAYAFHIAEN
jgi:prophage maintenance system killer protein